MPSYKLENTSEGLHWVAKHYNAATEQVETKPLPIGGSLYFDPANYLPGSEIFWFPQQPLQDSLKEDGTPYTLNDFIEELQKIPADKFKPSAFYNKEGDLLEIYLSGKSYTMKSVSRQIEVGHTDDGQIARILVWGLKKLLLEACG